MTYEELQTQVVYNLGNRNNPEMLAMIKARTNFVIDWLASQKEWEDLEKTISGSLTTSTYAYTLADLSLTDYDKIYAVKIYDTDRWDCPLIPVTRVVWNRDYQPNIDLLTGKPSVFCIFGGYIYLAKNPDADYPIQIDYYAKPTRVSDEASTIPFNNMDGLFEMLVTALSFLSLGEREMFETWWKLAAPMIEAFNLDSIRLLNASTPNRRTQAKPSPWLDPFARR